jgi:DNA-directed RNA polymerase subunit RPC12/RpoP
MTTQLNHAHSVSVLQEKNKMPFDYEPLSAFTQCSSLSSSTSADHCQSSSQPRLAQSALRPCIYLALRCSRCGSVRQAMAELPVQGLIACPECSRQCSFILLGSGLTSRSLPFHQVHIIEPTRWDPRLDGETNSS